MAGGTAGGGATGGGIAGGTSGGLGGGSAFDAGHLNCTFETPFLLGDAVSGASAVTQVAVTQSGQAIYAWNHPQGVRSVVQSASGQLGAIDTEPNAAMVPGSSLVASGDRALLVFSVSSGLVASRYTTSGGWTDEPIALRPPVGTQVALESNGAASIWFQETFFSGPQIEVTSNGTTPFGSPYPVLDAGLLYAARRASGTRVVVGTVGIATAPEIVVSSGPTNVRVPMPGASNTGFDLYRVALTDDGTAVVAGVFNVGGSDGIGAMVGVAGTFGPPQLVGTPGDGGISELRTLGALAGPGGRATVIWQSLEAVLIARRSGTTWSAPQVIAPTDSTRARFSVLDAARGLVHYVDRTSGMARFIEVGVDGYVGPPSSTLSPGVVFGNEYAGAGSKAAAISVSFASDGGLLVYGSQCR